MRLVFDERSPLNTNIYIRTSSYKPGSPQRSLKRDDAIQYYHICTPLKLFGSDVTSFYKRAGASSGSGSGHGNGHHGGQSREILFATADFKSSFNIKKNTVTYRDQKMKVDDFIPHPGVVSRSRIVKGTQGNIYKWKIGDAHTQRFELYDDQKRLVARFGFPIFPYSKEKLYLDINDERVPSVDDVDLIVLSCMLVRRVDFDRINIGYPYAS